MKVLLLVVIGCTLLAVNLWFFMSDFDTVGESEDESTTNEGKEYCDD